MITVAMPDGQLLRFDHAVFDYNGTLAVDGIISDEVKSKLTDLAELLHVVVITADTFGLVQSQLADVPGIELVILDAGPGDAQKMEFVRRLSPHVLVVGNGMNDRLMFGLAAMSICVISREGASGRTFANADIIVTRPEDALDLLLKSGRMVATLRR